VQLSYLKKTRTRETYLEKIQTKAKGTVALSKVALNKWDAFCVKQYQKNGDQVVLDLISEDEQTRFDTLQAYVNYLNEELASSTIPNYFSKLSDFLYYMGIKLDPRDVKHNISFPIIHEQEAEPFTVDEQQMIINSVPNQKKAIYLCSSSSGMRIGSIMQLRKKDISYELNRPMVKVRAETTKKKRSYTTFFSKEADKYLRPLLKTKEDDELIFTKNPDWHHAEINEGNIFRRRLVQLGWIDRTNTGRYKKNIHSFRSHFITKVARHDANLSKKMSGQKGYLLSYDRLSDQELLEEYLKFEPDLLIFDTMKKDLKITQLQEVIKQKEGLQAQIDRIYDLLGLGFTPYQTNSRADN
jgi:integrase